MNKILLVTSMNDKLFEQFASVCLDEFEENAGPNIEMINYVDKGTNRILKKKFKKIQNTFLECKLHEKFLKFFGNLAEANGIRIIVKKKQKLFVFVKVN